MIHFFKKKYNNETNTIYHTYWSSVQQLRYHLGARNCRIQATVFRGCPVNLKWLQSHSMKFMEIPIFQWPCQEPIYWTYLGLLVSPIFQAYVSGNFPWPYMVQYLHKLDPEDLPVNSCKLPVFSPCPSGVTPSPGSSFMPFLLLVSSAKRKIWRFAMGSQNGWFSRKIHLWMMTGSSPQETKTNMNMVI